MVLYDRLVRHVLDQGDFVETRFGPSRELRGLHVQFSPHELVHRRGINYRLGWMEFFQLLGGVFDPAAIQRVAPRADHSLFTKQSAYGPRVAAQLPRVIAELVENPTTRQAVIFIADPSETCTSDLPCTMSYQFLLRQGRLDAVVSMRSWDLIKGLAYDVVMFGGLLQAVARILGVVNGVGVWPGDVSLQAGSAHVYESDLEKVPTNKTAQWYLAPAWSDVVRDGRWEDRYYGLVSWARRTVEGPWPDGPVPTGIKVVDVNNVVRRLSRQEGVTA